MITRNNPSAQHWLCCKLACVIWPWLQPWGKHGDINIAIKSRYGDWNLGQAECFWSNTEWDNGSRVQFVHRWMARSPHSVRISSEGLQAHHISSRPIYFVQSSLDWGARCTTWAKSLFLALDVCLYRLILGRCCLLLAKIAYSRNFLLLANWFLFD